MDNERVQSVNDVITGIARRSSYKFKTRSVEDLSQEMWLEVLKTEDKLGMPLTLDYIARICYNTVVDLQRHDMIRNSLSIDEDDCEKTHEDSLDDRIVLKNLFSKYPESSLEGQFLRFYATKSGIADFYSPSNSRYKDGYTDTDLAKRLGFSGTSDRRWKTFRDNFREYLRKYFYE